MNPTYKDFLEKKGLSPLTIQNYLYLEKKLPPNLDQESINTFCAEHNNPTAFAMLKNYRACYDRQFVVPNHKEKTTEIMKDMGGYIPMAKIDLIMSKAKRVRDLVLFLLIFRSGRRISEVLPLKVNDINFDDGVILFGILKKRRVYKRYKAVDSQIIGILKEYVTKAGLEGEDYLFTSILSHKKHKKPITRFMAHILFREMCEKAGITRVGEKKPHIHHLRHSHAINFLKNTNSPYGIKIVQQQLEHSDLKSTSIYLQFSQSDQKKMLEKAFVRMEAEG